MIRFVFELTEGRTVSKSAGLIFGGAGQIPVSSIRSATLSYDAQNRLTISGTGITGIKGYIVD